MGVRYAKRIITGAILRQTDFEKINVNTSTFYEDYHEGRNPNFLPQNKKVELISLNVYRNVKKPNEPILIIGKIIKELPGHGDRLIDGDDENTYITPIERLEDELNDAEIQIVKESEKEILQILKVEKLDFIKIQTYFVQYLI